MAFLSRTLLVAALWAGVSVAENVTFTNETLSNVCDSHTEIDPEYGPPFSRHGGVSIGLPVYSELNSVYDLRVGLRDTRDNATNRGVQRLSAHLGMTVENFEAAADGALKLCVYQLSPFVVTEPDRQSGVCHYTSLQCDDYAREFESSFNLTAAGDCPEFDKDGSKCGGLPMRVASLTPSDFTEDFCDKNTSLPQKSDDNTPSFRTTSLYGMTYDDADSPVSSMDMFDKHVGKAVPIFFGATYKPKGDNRTYSSGTMQCITPNITMESTATSFALQPSTATTVAAVVTSILIMFNL